MFRGFLHRGVIEVDLRDRDLTPAQIAEVQRFIVQRKLAYQPFIFTDALQVGEGQKFRDGEFAERTGNVHWTGHPPQVDDLITQDVESFQAANAELRSVYDGIVEFIVSQLGIDLAQLTFAEFGCNTGYFLHSLAARGAKKTTGYDFTENSEIFAWFNNVLGITPERNEFRFAEWDSLNHAVRYADFEEADVCLSIAVTCHLADPLHHLAFLCSKARKAVFFWCPVTEHGDLSISYSKPAQYPNSLAWPVNFDNAVRLSPALLRLTLENCGFGKLTELPTPELNAPFANWFQEQKGFMALRTAQPATVYTGGRKHRERPWDAAAVKAARMPRESSRHSAEKSFGESLPRSTSRALKGSKTVTKPMEFVVNYAKPAAKVSVILLDWGVRESFHSLKYLNWQTVDRSRYELIWIEFYDRKPKALFDAVADAEKDGKPLVDKLVVMNHPKEFIFHKHRMYNLGIAAAEGEICVICDSDAMFTPTFIERIIEAFEKDPHSVIHLDEVRSVSRQFYPFNYPTFEEFLASECPNWTGRTTKGLDNSRDMLHEANYGACLAARRDDIIRIGGADEHLDYLGYICGPYELTFRLVNSGCTERWLTDEYLYHTWHPGESGINIDYHGPSDGRGMACRALETRVSGRVEPGLENGAIRALRDDPSLDRDEALKLLSSPADAEWRDVARLGDSVALPRLVKKAFRGSFDVYLYRGSWFGIPTSEEPFDPVKAKAGVYSPCLRSDSRQELDRILRRAKWIESTPLFVKVVYRRLLPWFERLRNLFGMGSNKPFDPNAESEQLVREGYRRHNIIHFRGMFFGIAQSQGAFSPGLAQSESDCPYLRGSTIDDVKYQIRLDMGLGRLGTDFLLHKTVGAIVVTARGAMQSARSKLRPAKSKPFIVGSESAERFPLICANPALEIDDNYENLIASTQCSQH